MGDRQRVAVEVGIVAVADGELVAIGIADGAVGCGVRLAEGECAISSVPGEVADSDQLSREFELCLGVILSLEVGDAAFDGLHLARDGQSVEFAELLKDLQLHAASLPYALRGIPFGISQQILSVVLANPAVLEVEHDFLSHSVVSGQGAGVERYANASSLVLDVHHLIQVATCVVSADPAMDDDVFLDGVAEVSPILPVFCLEFGNGGVGCVRCAWHNHRRIVKVLFAACGCSQQQQHAQIEVKSLCCHICCRFDCSK